MLLQNNGTSSSSTTTGGRSTAAVRNLNEGHWEYSLDYIHHDVKTAVTANVNNMHVISTTSKDKKDTPTMNMMKLTVRIPKDQDKIDLDLQSTYMSLIIHGQIFRLSFLLHPIQPEQATAQRSHVSGQLLILVPLQHPIIVGSNENQQFEEDNNVLVGKNYNMLPPSTTSPAPLALQMMIWVEINSYSE